MAKKYVQEIVDIMERLSESDRLHVFQYAQFLLIQDEDITLYNETKANDDGYRISSDDLRKKYEV